MDSSEPGRQIYASANGDRWNLLHDPTTGRSFVRHLANPASGAQVSDIGLTAFLGSGRNGPEHQELWRLISTLVDEDGPKQRLIDIA
jgi:hypothetical protein